MDSSVLPFAKGTWHPLLPAGGEILGIGQPCCSISLSGSQRKFDMCVLCHSSHVLHPVPLGKRSFQFFNELFLKGIDSQNVASRGQGKPCMLLWFQHPPTTAFSYLQNYKCFFFFLRRCWGGAARCVPRSSVLPVACLGLVLQLATLGFHFWPPLAFVWFPLGHPLAKSCPSVAQRCSDILESQVA